MMRITQGMLNQQMLYDIESNTTRLSQLQNEVSTGHRINCPADDPVGTTYVMRYSSDLAYYQQYQTNATGAQSWLSYTNTAMNQAQQVMQRARDLAVQGASDSMTQSDRQAIATQVNQLYEQLAAIGNSQYNGQYIFNGQMTNMAPYSNSSAESSVPNTGSVLYDVGDHIQVNVNTSGSAFFGSAVPAGSNMSQSDNAFALLKNLSTALNNNDGQQASSLLSQFDSRLSKMSAAEADVGARSNRIQFEQSRLTDLTNNFQSLLAGVQDADMAKTITDLTSAQTVQQASLQIGAQIIQPTLLSFLK